MGESCDEGGPFPSHKIPQKNELERNAHNGILFICQCIILQKIPVLLLLARPSRSLSVVPLMWMSPLFKEETSITIDYIINPIFNLICQNRIISSSINKMLLQLLWQCRFWNVVVTASVTAPLKISFYCCRI